MEKLIVAPQIVIYKNAFKNSKNLINLLESDNPDSLFSPWNSWYEQGYRKYAFFDKDLELNSFKNEYSKEEKQYLKEICDIFDFIKEDYFNDFKKEKGIWPSLIDWSQIDEKRNMVSIDYFKYDIKKYEGFVEKKLIQEYHVDDYLLDVDISSYRHAITINYYLNNEYSGGEICAYDSVSKKSYMYKPNPGDVVVMPSTEPFYHAVKFFKNSDRYFLRIFVDYYIEGKGNIEEFDETNKEYIKNHMQTIKIFSEEERVE